jgi:drug/metabolite transporter (DMT)-like permease
MGVVSPIVALGVLVPFTAGLIAGEHLTNVHTLGVVAAIIGIVLASAPEVTGSAGWRPVFFAVAAAVLLGFSMLALARGAQGSVLVTLVIMRGVTLLALPVAYARSADMRGLPIKLLALYGAIGCIEVIANVTFGYSYRVPGASLSLISVLGSLYPISTVLLAAIVHKERMVAVQYIGIGFALAGVGLVSA